MSTLSVTTVTTGLSTTDLTLKTGNTAAGDIVIQSDGLGMILAGNSSSNTVDIAPNGHVGISNGSVNTFIMSSTGVLTIANTLTSKIFSGNTVLVKETSYTTAGTATHTKVANLVAMVVYCVGAGGGGGGATGTAVATGAYGAAGGGGGGVAIKILTNAEIGATSNVVVGTGGTAGATAVAVAVAGSNSSFADSAGTLITGQGGVGATGITPGAGGGAVNADLTLPGENGQVLLGTGVALAVGLSGAGGASALAFGAGGGPNKNAAGRTGTLYGGGGGGGAQGNTAASVAGGAGRNGLVWVIEYYNGV